MSPRAPDVLGRGLPAHLEPLTEARVAYFEKERRELVGLNFAETIRSPLALMGSPRSRRDVREPSAAREVDGEALGYVGYFAELLDEWAQEADADERLVSAWCIDAWCAGGRSAGRAAGALLRILVVAIAGGVSRSSRDAVGCGDGLSHGVSQRGARDGGGRACRSSNASRARGGTPRFDCNAFGEDIEVRSRAPRRAESRLVRMVQPVS